MILKTFGSISSTFHRKRQEIQKNCKLFITWSVLSDFSAGNISSLCHRKHQEVNKTVCKVLRNFDCSSYNSISFIFLISHLLLIHHDMLIHFCFLLDYSHKSSYPYYCGRRFRNIPGGLLDDRRMRWVPSLFTPSPLLTDAHQLSIQHTTPFENKITQNKTKQNKTKQNKTKQYNTIQYNTIQDKTRQLKIR